MTDLDRQVAEAQGWVLSTRRMLCTEYHISVNDVTVWIGLDNEILETQEHYTPSINLNQAVEFAEWAIQSNHHLGWFSLYRDRGMGWSAHIQDYQRPLADPDGNVWIRAGHPAEALCLAVLKALGKESKS